MRARRRTFAERALEEVVRVEERRGRGVARLAEAVVEHRAREDEQSARHTTDSRSAVPQHDETGPGLALDATRTAR